ncbi:hypothetical protein BRSU_2353 [Brachyspira suanatina]|uniref:DUF3604 domain-containing protein n=1 Tax=Brachyspira suanatina TaxID=381802 RepID=A0A0G4K9P7_9SPIR|nr:hypothetical protein [Brachyspira suanatina]CRF34945.1 hypothetical protein BRSU_2353 [Brachyspira suanatina]
MRHLKLFTDLHSNLHHEQIHELEKWYNHAKEMLDFWAVVYYPYHVVKTEGGMPVETIHSDEIIKKDWEYIRNFLKEHNDPNFPVFLAYEWQGNGEDGDHNVFFLDDGEPIFPLTYKELCDQLPKTAIAIPHHVGYLKGFRGKNWDTHNEEVSPVVEIFSSHGSSESAFTDLPMVRHIHMGPRTGGGTVFDGLNRGYKFGIIASGDNHVVSTMYEHGFACIKAKSKSKNDIWEAIKNREVYAVTSSKILLDYDYKENTHNVEVYASDAVSRIELIKNGNVHQTYVHNGTWEEKELGDTVKFKFKIEFGWGPDTKIFEDISSKVWDVELQTSGKIVSVEKCFSTFGQHLEWDNKSNKCKFTLTSHKNTQSGKWMGPSPITNEAVIFEIEDNINSDLILNINGKEFKKKISDILANTDLIVFLDEAKKLVLERYNLKEFYRGDPFYQNAYKVRLLKGAPEMAYKVNCSFKTDKTNIGDYYLVKVIQRDGAVAWSSPIWIS